MDKNSVVEIGLIGRPFGLKGEVSLHLYNEKSNTLLPKMKVYLKLRHHSSQEALMDACIESVRWNKNKAILKFIGIDDVESVKNLVQGELLVLRTELPALKENEYYLRDILGFDVFEHPWSEGNKSIGKIKSFSMNNANQTIIQIRMHSGLDLDILAFPFIKRVDLKRSHCYIMIPEYVE